MASSEDNRFEDEYMQFRSLISMQKVIVDNPQEVWTLYDAGPKNVSCPLLFLPPAIGTADTFFKQIIALSTKGYRIVTLSYPVYWNLDDFVKGFTKLIDHLGFEKVHLFGASLGGYLAQKFAEQTRDTNRVQSLFLCNSFHDTSIFKNTSKSGLYWTFPTFVLRRMLIQHLPSDDLEINVAQATDFIVTRMDMLTRSELASRLTINASDSYVEPQKLKSIPTTVMDVFDKSAITQTVKDDMYKCYPHAKRAHLKTGGNFPYISRSVEVNIYIEIHLKQFVGAENTALDPSTLSSDIAELIRQLRELEKLEKGELEDWDTALNKPDSQVHSSTNDATSTLTSYKETVLPSSFVNPNSSGSPMKKYSDYSTPELNGIEPENTFLVTSGHSNDDFKDAFKSDSLVVTTGSLSGKNDTFQGEIETSSYNGAQISENVPGSNLADSTEVFETAEKSTSAQIQQNIIDANSIPELDTLGLDDQGEDLIDSIEKHTFLPETKSSEELLLNIAEDNALLDISDLTELEEK